MLRNSARHDVAATELVRPRRRRAAVLRAAVVAAPTRARELELAEKDLKVLRVACDVLSRATAAVALPRLRAPRRALRVDEAPHRRAQLGERGKDAAAEAAPRSELNVV